MKPAIPLTLTILLLGIGACSAWTAWSLRQTPVHWQEQHVLQPGHAWDWRSRQTGLDVVGELPAGMQADRASLSWTPTADDVGEHRVTLDLAGRPGRARVTLKLSVARPAQPPQLHGPATVKAIEGEAIHLDLTVEDPFAEQLNVYLFQPPAGLSAHHQDGRVALAWTPDVPGDYEVTLGANNGMMTARHTVTFQIGNRNDPPVISSTPRPHVVVGKRWEYPLQVSDPDQDELTIELLDAPPGMALDEATRLITWTPPQGAANADLRLQVRDGHGGLARQAATLRVVSIDKVASIGDTFVYAEELEDGRFLALSTARLVLMSAAGEELDSAISTGHQGRTFVRFGDYLYVSEVTETAVFRLRHETLERLGSLVPLNAYRLIRPAAVGPDLLVHAGQMIDLYSLEDPASPTKHWTLDPFLRHAARHVQVDGDRMYVFQHGSVRIYSYAPERPPELLGEWETDNLNPLFARSGKVYCGASKAIAVYDLGNPEKATHLATTSVETHIIAGQISAHPNGFEIANEHQRMVVDLDEQGLPLSASLTRQAEGWLWNPRGGCRLPTAPRTGPADATNLALHGDLLYVADTRRQLWPMTVSEPARPQMHAPLPIDGRNLRIVDSIMIAGNHLYDLATPLAPVQGSGWEGQLAAFDGKRLVSWQRGELIVYDREEGATLSERYRLGGPDRVHDLVLYGEWLIVSRAATRDLALYRLGQTAGELVREHAVGEFRGPRSLHVAGDRLYYLVEAGVAGCYSLTDLPELPTLSSTTAGVDLYASIIRGAGTYAVKGNRTRGLCLYEMSDTHARLLHHNRHGLIHDIARYRDYVFTAEQSAGLGIYHCPALAPGTP